MFSIGEKVVCIKAFNVRYPSYEMGERYPVKGDMYTIRTVNVEHDGCFLRFEELINPMINYSDKYGEGQFISDNFRKLDYDFVEEVIANLKEIPCEISEGVTV